MTNPITVFENEDATRLFDYFISYKKLISKNEFNKEVHSETDLGLPTSSLFNDYDVTMGVVPKAEELVIK